MLGVNLYSNSFSSLLGGGKLEPGARKQAGKLYHISKPTDLVETSLETPLFLSQILLHLISLNSSSQSQAEHLSPHSYKHIYTLICICFQLSLKSSLCDYTKTRNVYSLPTRQRSFVLKGQGQPHQPVTTRCDNEWFCIDHSSFKEGKADAYCAAVTSRHQLPYSPSFLSSVSFFLRLKTVFLTMH